MLLQLLVLFQHCAVSQVPYYLKNSELMILLAFSWRAAARTTKWIQRLCNATWPAAPGNAETLGLRAFGNGIREFDFGLGERGFWRLWIWGLGILLLILVN